jgi:hypothetical protein
MSPATATSPGSYTSRAKHLEMSLATIRDDDALGAQGRDLAAGESFSEFLKYCDHVAGLTATGAEIDTDQREGDQKMSDTMIEIAEGVAKGMPTAFTKADFYRELDERAQRDRKTGETREQAFTRYATPDTDGRTLLAAHKVAPGPGLRRAGASD